ncbi:origin recognition complex subunit 2-domain-containing protein [Obelidium mucronatum]|nr:origin recognition complex subunit 2-domain-containing protein [Obelidium mucronatum]
MSDSLKDHLWHTAETQFERARQLVARGDQRAAATAVATGVRLLEAALRLPLSGGDALRTRLRAADALLVAGLAPAAEAHLQKAVLLSPAAAGNPDLKASLAATHVAVLQHFGNTKQAKAVLKQAALDAQLSMAKDAKAMRWFYYFVSERVNVLVHERDFKAAHAALASAAKTENLPKQACAAFLLRRLCFCIHTRDHSQAVALIANHLDPLWPDDCLLNLTASFLIAKVMVSCQTGDKKNAKIHVEDLCRRVLDTATAAAASAADSIEEKGSSMEGIVAENSLTDFVVVPDLLSQSQEISFVCLIAGCVLKDSETSRSIEYLKRGIQDLENVGSRGPDASDTTIQDVINARKWHMEYHLLCLHHLVEAYLLKGDAKSAENALFTLIDKLHETTTSSILIKSYLPTILLDWGLIHQANGRLREASRCYFGAAAVAVEVAKQDGNIGVEALVHEIRILASFCNVVVLLGSGEVGRLEMAKQILEELGKDINEPIVIMSSTNATSPATPASTTTSGTSSMAECDHVKAFLSLCNALVAHKNGEIKKTNDTVLSTQLKIVTLILLGNVFLETDVGQTEKMIHTAYKLCKKAGVKSMGKCSTVCVLTKKKKKDILHVAPSSDKKVSCNRSMPATPVRLQPSYFSGSASTATPRAVASALTEPASASARKQRGSPPRSQPAARADDQLQFVLEDRRRARTDNGGGGGGASDGDSDSGGENALAALSGKAVFAFDALVSRERRKKLRRQQADEAAALPLTPSKQQQPQHQQQLPPSSAKKSVAFRPTISLPATPSRIATRSSNSSSGTTPAKPPHAAHGRPPRIPSPKLSSKPQSTTATATATPERRATRSLTGSLPVSVAPTPKTPKGRTPDAKLAARKRLLETVAVSDSESEEDGDSDDEDECDEDTSDDEEEQEPNYDADAVAAVSDNDEDCVVVPSKFGHKESDYDRDIQRRGKTRADVEDYFVETGTSGAKKNLTSNNTLSSLPVVTRAEFMASLEKMPFKHKRERNQLLELIPTKFKEWSCELSLGFNLLLYGYGSKRKVLGMFKEQECQDSPVLTLNGYMPSVNLLTDLLGKISIGILGKDSSKPLGPASTQINNIGAYFHDATRPHSCLYLLINSIDGPALRLPKQQLLLQALLQSVPRGTIRVIATIDHINAPLLWDRQAADVFHWLWKDATTYEEYFEETSYEGLVMVEAETRKGANGAVHVLRSLNSNARKMFKILADSQLEIAANAGGGDGGADEEEARGANSRKKRRVVKGDEEGGDSGNTSPTASNPAAGGGDKAIGLPYYKFLNQCIENFCVNSQDNFKAQLAEFRDHRIILSKRGSQGEEMLYIPFDVTTLKTLLGQITF